MSWEYWHDLWWDYGWTALFIFVIAVGFSFVASLGHRTDGELAEASRTMVDVVEFEDATCYLFSRGISCVPKPCQHEVDGGGR